MQCLNQPVYAVQRSIQVKYSRNSSVETIYAKEFNASELAAEKRDAKRQQMEPTPPANNSSSPS